MPRQPNGRPTIYLGADGKHHCYVTVGTKPNGKLDRRHLKRATSGEVADAIEDLIRRTAESGGTATTRVETVADWLVHYLENIVRPAKPQTTYRGYKTLIDRHIIPTIGHWRLDGTRRRLQPEHLEEMYAAMRDRKRSQTGRALASATVLKAHRILSRALDMAVRRGKAGRNVCDLVDPPSSRGKRIEAYDLADAQALLVAAASDAMAARWLVGLLLGPRQGETLGLRWHRVKLTDAVPHVLIVKQVQRYTWEHGCDDAAACARLRCRTKPCPQSWEHGCGDPAGCRAGPSPRHCPARRPRSCRHHQRACPPPCRPGCARHASTCPERVNGGLVEVDVKSERGERTIPLPPAVVEALERRRQEQMREAQARDERWDDHGLVFTRPDGSPFDPRRDWAAWKALTVRAGVRDDRLHAGRHTAATLLCAMPDTKIEVAQDVLGHSDIRVTRGYVDVAMKAKADALNRLAAVLLDGQLGLLLQPNPATQAARE